MQYASQVLTMIHREHRQQKKTRKGIYLSEFMSMQISHIENMTFQTNGTTNSCNQSPFYTVNKIFHLSTDTLGFYIKTFIVNSTLKKRGQTKQDRHPLQAVTVDCSLISQLSRNLHNLQN